VDIEEHFKIAQKTDEGHLRPSKRSMADLIVSRSGVNHAVDFAYQLFLALMKKVLAVALSDPTTHMERRFAKQQIVLAGVFPVRRCGVNSAMD
jgi:hypothetical protein